MQEKFNVERKEMLQKIDKITLELAQKERTIHSLETQKEAQLQQIASKDKTIAEIRQEIYNEKGQSNEKMESLRQKMQETLDELSAKKIEYERERALRD